MTLLSNFPWHDKEITTKEKAIENLEKQRYDIGMSIKNVLSFIDFNYVLHYYHNSINEFVKKVKTTHANKLFQLGGFHKIPTNDPDKVVINLSDYCLSSKEKSILSFGLSHCLHPKFSKVRYFTAFETLYNRLKDLPFYNISAENFKKFLKNMAYKVMHKSKIERVFDIFYKRRHRYLEKIGWQQRTACNKTR